MKYSFHYERINQEIDNWTNYANRTSDDRIFENYKIKYQKTHTTTQRKLASLAISLYLKGRS
jgi:hypothetical protein